MLTKVILGSRHIFMITQHVIVKCHLGLPAYRRDQKEEEQKLTLSTGHIVVTKPKVVPDGMGQVAAILEDSFGPFC